jgi:hypothetical protein
VSFLPDLLAEEITVEPDQGLADFIFALGLADRLHSDKHHGDEGI